MIFKFNPLKDRRQKDRGADRRSEQRYQCSLPVSIYVMDDNPYSELAQVVDISTFGIRLQIQNKIKNLTPVRIKFFLNSDGLKRHTSIEASCVSTYALSLNEEYSKEIYHSGFIFNHSLTKNYAAQEILNEYSKL